MAATSTFNVFLVGVDDATLADHAIVVAERVRSLRDGTLELVHVIKRRPGNRADEIRVATEASERQTLRLGRLEQAHGLEPGSLSRRLRIVFGQPGQVMADKAAEGPADIVFLGPHAKRGLVDLGSTARSTLEGTSCCVWIQPCPATPIEHALVAVDGSAASMHALELGRRLADRMQAELTVLFCLQGRHEPALGKHGEDAALELGDTLARYPWDGVAHDFVVAEEEPVDAILGRQASTDVIVVGTHGHTGLKKVLLGNVSNEVVRKAEKPVVVVPRPNM